MKIVKDSFTDSCTITKDESEKTRYVKRAPSSHVPRRLFWFLGGECCEWQEILDRRLAAIESYSNSREENKGQHGWHLSYEGQHSRLLVASLMEQKVGLSNGNPDNYERMWARDIFKAWIEPLYRLFHLTLNPQALLLNVDIVPKAVKL